MAALVIGYGNTIRRDDGAGVAAAELVAEAELAGTRVITCHQLAPELCIDVAAADVVVFVDAREVASGDTVTVEEVLPQSDSASSHSASPGGLMAMAMLLFAGQPVCYIVTIPGTDFSIGEGLSAGTEALVREAAETIRRLATPAG